MPELTIELVPKTCWYSNMRSVMSQTQWDRLRREVYAQYGYCCGICGASGRLECHEIWHYDDEQYVQLLEGFIALCTWCHHVKHMGLSGILAEEGKLDYDRVVAHFQTVNACDRATFDEQLEAAWKVWEARSQHEWRTDLGQYGSLVTQDSQSGSAAVAVSTMATGTSNPDRASNGSKPARPASGDSEMRPSIYTAAYWLYADRKVGSYPDHTDRGGKWMVFVPVAEVDDAWSAIKEAVEAGLLGESAKVATARPNPNAISSLERVICVYTYDADDYEDVHRVRQALRHLGFTKKLPYKTDEATRAGKYRASDNARVSTYYE